MRTIRLSLAGVVLAASLASAAEPANAPVADAARAGDHATVVRLLRAGSDANAALGDGMTALHWAALRGDVETVRVLLYAGANLQATTRVGAYTPLLVASRYGRAEVIEALLEARADPDSRTANGTTPLMLAAAAGATASVTALLEHGASVEARETVHGQTPLIFAAARNQVEAITLLVAGGADPDVSSEVIDIVGREREWREAFARRRREAALRAEAAKTEQASATDKAPAEAAAAELKGQESEAGPAEEEPGAASPSQEAEPGGPADTRTASTDDESSEPGGAHQAKSEVTDPVPPAEDPELANIPGVGAAPAEGAATEANRDAPKSEAGDELEGNEEAPKRLSYGELIGLAGGLSPLHHAVRQGHREAAQALLELGADTNARSGDGTSPLLMAVINGHFDLALFLLQQGADPNAASDAGATPLYAALNVRWAPKALYPQPRAQTQQRATHLDLMRALLDAGAAVDPRLEKKVWYSGYNFDLSGIDETGATPFWRAAYAGDLEAMELLVAHGADRSVRTRKPPGRPRTGDATREVEDVSDLPEVPVGGPAVAPLHAASGAGYGEGFAANSHRHAPGSWVPAVAYLIELGADVNAVDHEGNTALHHAAARGDDELIRYLVSVGADVSAVNREGQTVVDMANGPVQRIQPFPETVALLESLGAINNNKCVSC